MRVAVLIDGVSNGLLVHRVVRTFEAASHIHFLRQAASCHLYARERKVQMSAEDVLRLARLPLHPSLRHAQPISSRLDEWLVEETFAKLFRQSQSLAV